MPHSTLMHKAILTTVLSWGLSFTPAYAAKELTFQEAVKTALQNDAEYRASQKIFEAEQEETSIAKSRLLPQISLSANYSYEDSDNIYTDRDSGFYDPKQPRSDGELTDTAWQVSLNQPLLDYSATFSLDAARASVEASSYRFRKAEQDLVYKTTELYLRVLYKAQLVYLNQNILDALSLKLEQSQRRSELGVGDNLELLEVQARKDLAHTDLLQAKSELEDEQTKLSIITGVQFTPPLAWVKNAHNIIPPKQVHTEEKILELARNNNDYQERLSKASQSSFTRKANNAEHYPTLYLGLRYSDRNSDDPLRESETMSASLNLNVPIYSGGKTSASIRQSLARFYAEQYMAESILLDTQQKISLAYAKKRNTNERLQALKHSAFSSERYLNAAERGVELNLRSQVDVLDARTQMLDVQLRLADALNQYLLADLTLQYQVSELTPEYTHFYDELFKQTTAP